MVVVVPGTRIDWESEDPFVEEVDEQIRVLRLVEGGELKVES